MDSKVKKMPLTLFQKVGYSTRSGYIFAKKHPFLSGATLIFFILYMFLSYIYSFLAYLSPFFACTVIFLQIFWSSEKTQFKYVKKDKEKLLLEPRKIESSSSSSRPKIPLASRTRRELLNKQYPSQNATSRRRNFRAKRLDVYGGLEEKVKDLNAAFYNEFTAKNNKPPKRQTLRSEPSMRDLVEGSCGSEIEVEKIEDEEEEDETQEDSKKVIEWTADDERNLMDVGKSELERNKRLESLIAKRKHRKAFRFHPEKKNALDDNKSPMPKHLIPPLLVSRDNFIEQNTPGSSAPRSPYDIPYDPSEEKMDLTGGSFSQEFVIRPEDMPSSRRESFSDTQFSKQEQEPTQSNHVYSNSSGSKLPDTLPQPKLRQLPDKGSHDWLVDQLMCTAAEAAKRSEIDQTPNPLTMVAETITHELSDGKIQSSNNIIRDLKADDEKVAVTESSYIIDETKPMAAAAAPAAIINQAEQPAVVVSQSNKHVPKYSSNKPPGRLLYFSVPNNNFSTTATAGSENEYENNNFPSPLSKRHEAIFFGDRRNILNNCHTPTYSIASDLQVEVSEVGSLASTVDENGESSVSVSASEESSDDRDSSVLYDGDIDRDVSSGSEELWGASFHGNKQSQSQAGGGNNNVEEKDDDNDNNNGVEDDKSNKERMMMMMASTSTTVGGGSEEPQASTSTCSSSSYSGSSSSSPPKQLMRSSSTGDLPNNNGTQSQVSQEQEWSNTNNLAENNLINGVINNLNNLLANEQYNMEENSSKSNEDQSMLVARQESIDENSIFSIASSPRSVLPEKTMADDVPSSSAFDQQVDNNNASAQQLSTMEDLGQETTSSVEHPLENQPLIEDSTFELQVQSNPPENNSMEESNIIPTEINNEAEAHHNKEVEDKSKNNMNNEENSSDLNRQEEIAESSTQFAGDITTKDIDQMTMQEN
ncbi:hypothetical protein PIB30_018670 [Stylosanthes scabra]|uniref:Uncharacterized protein n=1 Tax=Stylosanthes scabra TaxID=79078 RepID=A0ABU6VB37_9FABA|nr:hypothetical protein [Stylosanthes scabra]